MTSSKGGPVTQVESIDEFIIEKTIYGYNINRRNHFQYQCDYLLNLTRNVKQQQLAHSSINQRV
jgi:hypothetical protein